VVGNVVLVGAGLGIAVGDAKAGEPQAASTNTTTTRERRISFIDPYHTANGRHPNNLRHFSALRSHSLQKKPLWSYQYPFSRKELHHGRPDDRKPA
jgi:hypothetical protein